MAQDTPLLSVTEARKRLFDQFDPLDIVEINLADAAGRILAEPVLASIPLPPFDNSAMDGFAVRAEDISQAQTNTPIELKVIGDIPAGESVDIQVQAGQAARIMTGAMMPAGADAVVPVENTDFQDRQVGVPAPDFVRIFRSQGKFDNVRCRGDDVIAGEQVLERGIRLRPQELGLLSMLGADRLKVHKKPSIAIFSSGDELVPVDMPLKPGKIHDSNIYTLRGLVESCKAEPVNLGIAGDKFDDVRNILDRAVAMNVNLILSSAGVSVGAMDFVRSVIEQEGRLEFWRVNMRPGKPIAFGYFRDTPFIGLPGNPVSAFVGFEVFVRPLLMYLQGSSTTLRNTIKVILHENIVSDGRESYLRAVVKYQNGELTARLTGHQGSGNLRSLVQANALLLIPSGVKSVPFGGQVNAWLFDDAVTSL